MRLLKFTDRGFDRAIAAFNRQAEPSEEVHSTVSEIIAAVRNRGDAALLEYTQKFGGPKLTPAKIRVSAAEIEKANASLSPAVKKALAASRKNVTAFAKQSLRQNWSMTNSEGALVGERFDPLPRVGLYIPGGTAPLVPVRS